MKLLNAKIGVVVGLLLNSFCLTAHAAPFQVISSSEVVDHGIRRIQMVVQNGSDSQNRFMFHRVVKAGLSNNAIKGAVILMPPLALGFNAYEFGDENGGTDFKNSIAANMAKKGIDVYGYSPRAALIAPNGCGAGGISCPVAASWGFDSILDDLVFVKNQVSLNHPYSKPAIGGLSLGAMATIAAINQAPGDFAGALLWEGTLYLQNPGLRANYQTMCNNIKTQIAAGSVLDDTVGALAKALLGLSLADPNGPSPFPFFPPGTTNRQALVLFFAAPAMGPPAVIFPPGFVNTPADFATSTFLFDVETRLTTTVNNFHHYVAQAVMRDIACGFGGEQTFTNNLANFNQPVLVVKAQFGFGSLLNDIEGLLSSADIEEIVTSGYGHITHHATADHKEVLDKPVIKWLLHDVF